MDAWRATSFMPPAAVWFKRRRSGPSTDANTLATAQHDAIAQAFLSNYTMILALCIGLVVQEPSARPGWLVRPVLQPV